MHLVADVTADGDLHGHHLAVEAGVHDLSELPERAHFGGSLGKYTSWCFGGSRETLVSLPMVRGVVEKGLAVRRGGVVL